ncbi:glutathione S-transferase C-terminal domain-containing protein [Streptomyces sp. NBC_01190]|uniref:glutathione S-transferase C-terminal domain-containing protein n=1 Tax=Streptomyces sp. NBC_01190 TaxID=2903767 RepID=UPI00386518BC|nr:glutathione S-transferase C-terminal domain-containing protein [Streptomyces sp. NBC_01190]
MRGRISTEAGGGFYPAPQRYRLYLSPGSPRSMRVSATLGLLGLTGVVVTTSVPALAEPPAGLRGAYEASLHRYSGPLTVPALCDGWSGRLVSNHTPDILRDLAERFRAATPSGAPDLRPPALVEEIDALCELLDRDVAEPLRQVCEGAAPASAPGGRPGAGDTMAAALEVFDHRLARRPFLLGGEPTAADVDLWAALVHLDAVHRPHLDAGTVRALAGYEHLWAYGRRLHAHPAFHNAFDRAETGRLHRHTCRGPESSGAAEPLHGVLTPRAA